MFKSLMPNLMVESVEEAIDFYINNLSFSLVQKVSNEEGELNFGIVMKDDCILSFQLKNNLIEEYPSLSVDKIRPSLTLFFRVDNVELLYTQLKTKVCIVSELHDTFYGTKEFAIGDNNGNILTFANA